MEDPVPSTHQRLPHSDSRVHGIAILLMAVTVTVVAVGTAWWYSNSATFEATRQTGRELDVAIFGRGYFQVVDADSGATYYTRYGRLSINADGLLTVGRGSDGRQLDLMITLPSDWTSIDIDKHGQVTIAQGSYGQFSQISSLVLAKFMNDEGLREVAPNIYAESDDSGVPIIGRPGEDGFGFLQQGWLESSSAPLAVGPFVIAGAFLVVVFCLCLLIEIRKLSRRLEDVIAQLPKDH